jgi:sporulation protein YlmC with PRC-barrel domain
MNDIPLKANVRCSDGACGKSTNVIINPVTHKVTHIVVQDKSLPENPTRMVPIGMVAGTTRTQITLSCTINDVAHMPPFKVTKLFQESAPGQAWESEAAFTYPVDEVNIATDEIALTSGMEIEASDGKVGKLDELVMDQKNGEITHLLMREGHLWGVKDVTVPISAVDTTDGKTIYLKLDKKAVKALPTAPVKR